MRSWVRLIRWPALMQALLGFALGTAVAIYRDLPLDPWVSLIAALVIVGLLIGLFGSLDFFAHPAPDLRVYQPIRVLGGSEYLGQQPLTRLIQIGVAGLGLAAISASFLVRLNALTLAPATVLGLAVIGLFAYSIPPLRAAESEYREVLVAVLLAAAAPAFGFSVHGGGIDPLLPIVGGVLAFALFASQIVLGLEHYRVGRPGSSALLDQIGWRAGMRAHDVSALVAFGLLISGIGLGMPRQVVLGGLLALPLALAQIWMLFRIRTGTPPRWPIMRLSAYVVVGLLTYLMLAGFLLA